MPSEAKVKLILDREEATSEVEQFKQEASQVTEAAEAGGAGVTAQSLFAAGKNVIGTATQVMGAGLAVAALLPGATQAPGIISDAVLSNTKSVYARATAINDAQEQTANLFAAAGEAADPESIKKVFDSLNQRNQREATGRQRVKKILAESRAGELGELAGELPGALSSDISASIKSIEGLLRSYIQRIG